MCPDEVNCQSGVNPIVLKPHSGSGASVDASVGASVGTSVGAVVGAVGDVVGVSVHA